MAQSFRNFKLNILYIIWLLVLTFFFYLMLQITIRYFPFSSDAAFLKIKQTEVYGTTLYLPIFYIHVCAAIFSLLAGFTQFNKTILKNHAGVHRKLGYLYVLVVLIFAAPSGLFIGFFANGGLITKVAFITLAILWFYFTFKALLAAKQKKIIIHKKFMIRSFALACSAITLRLWKVILVYLFELPPMDTYQIIAWLGFIPNLMFAEWIIKKKKMMMKYLSLFIVILFTTVSCSNNQKDETTNLEDSATVIPTKYDYLYGEWVGFFYAVNNEDGGNYKITLVIKKIENGKVFGHSVVAGNVRPFKGKLTDKNQKISFAVDEPGDDKYDGKFDFTLRNDSLIGFWNAYSKNITVTKRSFELTKKAFVYNANLILNNDEDDAVDWENGKTKLVTDTIDGKPSSYETLVYRSASDSIFTINASIKELKESDLKNLRKLDLEIIRNTIYARHGYSFKKRAYRQFFDYIDWYIPISNNIDAQLSNIEKNNIILLKRFEQYAEDNYDSFGR